jgi:hypothetical protein
MLDYFIEHNNDHNNIPIITRINVYSNNRMRIYTLMKILNKELCKAGTGRAFFIDKKYMTDDHIGEHFDLVITPTSIRSRILNLMSDGNTWNISDLATEVSTANQDYDTVVNFVESILKSIPEITKVGSESYRLTH